MNEGNKNGTRHAKSFRFVPILRWTARISGLLAVCIFVVFFISDCIKKGTFAVDSDRILSTLFLFIAFAGLLIGWKKEGTGAIITLIALFGFNMTTPASVNGPTLVALSLLYGFPAVLFLFCQRLNFKRNY